MLLSAIVSVASFASTAVPASAGAAPRLSIVQLGDSVASGEGTLYGYRYDTTTQKWTGGDLGVTWPGPYPKCHDSPDAYGNVVARRLSAKFTQFACSGASFENGITTPQVEMGLLSNTTYRPAQFGNWDTGKDLNAAYDAAKPDVVLVTFGADDLRFVKIVEDCVLNKYANSVSLADLQCTASNPGSTITSLFTQFIDNGRLADHYRELARWIRARGNAAKPALVPKVVFTMYPDPFPPRGRQCPDSSYLSPDQLTYLSGLVQEANSVIRTTIAGLDLPGVAVADLSDAYFGHTWCTPDPWAYGLSIYTVTDPSSFESEAPFHPTPRGQRELASIVAPVVRKLVND
jgi:lysophospholipase L1-like esterase